MAPRCWHWAGLLPQENFMGEGVCKEWLSMIMVGFWNKRALLANVFVHLYYYSSHRHVPLLLFMSVKLAFRVWLWGQFQVHFRTKNWLPTLVPLPWACPGGSRREVLQRCWRSLFAVLAVFCSGSVAQIWVHITDPNLDPCFYLLIKT